MHEAFDDELKISDKEEEEVGHGDVTCGRPIDLGTDSPKQPEILPSKYTLTAFGRKLRGFYPGWFSGRPRVTGVQTCALPIFPPLPCH